MRANDISVRRCLRECSSKKREFVNLRQSGNPEGHDYALINYIPVTRRALSPIPPSARTSYITITLLLLTARVLLPSVRIKTQAVETAAIFQPFATPDNSALLRVELGLSREARLTRAFARPLAQSELLDHSE
jgi:hypothetical protein